MEYSIYEILKMIEDSGTLLLEEEKQKAINEFEDYKTEYYRNYIDDVLTFLDKI